MTMPSGYRVVIGLETHVQLKTASKMFCRTSAAYASAPPNTLVCPVCLGMPGVLPVINAAAVDLTIMTGLALHSEIPPHAKFDRKNYAYPDLMKWYQISQYDLPLCVGGWLEVAANGETRRIRITRVHLEEDTAKLTHVVGDDGQPASLIDVNRSGVPLMEIVTEPDITSAEEAMAYGLKLRNILRWLGVSTANMQDGALRIDANVSVWPIGAEVGNTKVEVKNMNSFRALGQALDYEIERQIDLLERGERLEQETRGWDESDARTVSQRTKEYAHDYRYFPEPDLPPLEITRERVQRLTKQMPELPDAVRQRLVDELGVTSADADELIEDRDLAAYTLDVIERHAGGAAEVVTWVLQDVRRLLNARELGSDGIPISAAAMAQLLALRAQGDLSSTMAGTVLEEMFATGKSLEEVVAARGRQISDSDALVEIAREVMAANPQAVADYHAGKDRAVQFLMGQVMRQTRGQANPGKVTELLRAELSRDRGA
ncbi:MAG: Asp-tRNA(Asn)/Glu-tRNA(Gln) amidotransferase subunit GatB [Chloroflexi bacterium]|nr:Asp-tRNA(Asn)/Glu-tRNA(Gln) amidotransferase subunit GatB [Chloroflexota bacterium]